MKQSLLAWERQAKQDREYWEQVKRAEQPAAPITLASGECDAQKVLQKAVDDERKRTAKLTGIIL